MTDDFAAGAALMTNDQYRPAQPGLTLHLSCAAGAVIEAKRSHLSFVIFLNAKPYYTAAGLNSALELLAQ